MLKRQFLSLSLVALGLAHGVALAQTVAQTPDGLVKQVSTEVLDSIKPTRPSRVATPSASSRWSTPRSCRTWTSTP
ncbi:hypothetical protein Y694_01664 [Methylibium sp. T29-B]|nr:hypothetical protein Y694_01664 [Methylibium sp. T29-B]